LPQTFLKTVSFCKCVFSKIYEREVKEIACVR